MIRGRAVAGAASFVAGIAAVGFATVNLARSGDPSLSLEIWLVGLCLCVTGLGLAASFPGWLPGGRRELGEVALVLAIVLVAFGFRFVNLAGIPPDVHGDEGAVGIAARRILAGTDSNLFGLGWAGLPELSFAFSSMTLRVFGDNLFGLRMASVIEGTLSVALLYGVTKQLFSTRIAALSAVIFATAQMAVHYSRIGNNYISALFASLLFVYFLLRGLSRGQLVDYLIAGYAAGLALSVYYPARLTLALGFFYCVHRAVGEREFLRRHWSGLLWVVVGTCIFFAPQVVHYASDPASAFARTRSVYVLTPDNLKHELDAYKVTTVEAVLVRQFLDSVGAFNLLGESAPQYGQRGPLLDFWSGALFVLGAALVTVKVRSARYLLLASWLWLSVVLESALTLNAMFSPHEVALLAIIPILPSLILDLGWRGATIRFGRWGQRLGAVVVIAFIAATSYANYVDYFIVHLKTMEDTTFFTNLSRYVGPVNDRYRVFLLANADVSLRYDTALFLMPSVDGVDVRNFPLPLPLARLPAEKGIVFVDTSLDDPRFKAILQTYPLGIKQEHKSLLGITQFWSYQVENRDLRAANPSAAIDHAPIPALNLDALPPPT